ncbi:hypothetical protein F4782DRAFT_535122 [Xylaria castorea]|nr:hypothetical protein F4782DRAFT_535122 [Xylaria castorea]
MFQQPVPVHPMRPSHQSMSPMGGQHMNPSMHHHMTQSRIPTPIRPPPQQVTPVPPIDPRIQRQQGGSSGKRPSGTPPTTRETRSSTKKNDEEAGRGRGRGRSGGRIVTYDSAFDDDDMFYPDNTFYDGVAKGVVEPSESQLSELSDREGFINNDQEMNDTQTLRGNSNDIDDINKRQPRRRRQYEPLKGGRRALGASPSIISLSFCSSYQGFRSNPYGFGYWYNGFSGCRRSGNCGRLAL